MFKGKICIGIFFLNFPLGVILPYQTNTKVGQLLLQHLFETLMRQIIEAWNRNSLILRNVYSEN